ncbi:MAG: ABC transporter ATP-binding protein [Bacillota bacterium]
MTSVRSIIKSRKETVFVILFALISGVSSVFFPYFVGKAVDSYQTWELFLKYLAFAGGFAIISGVMQYVSTKLGGYLSAGLVYEYEEKLHTKILNADMQSLGKISKGEISQMMTSDISNVADGVSQGLASIFQAISLVLSTLIIMLFLRWEMALVVGLATPISIMVSGYIAKNIQKYFTKERAKQGEVYTFLTEHIKNASEVRNLSADEETKAKLDVMNKNLEGKSQKAHFYSALINPTQRILNNMIYIAVGLCGILLSMSVGSITTFLVYSNQYSKPFSDISALFGVFQKAKTSADRINGMLQLPEIQRDGLDLKENKKGETPAIAFENLSFSFGEKEFIKDMNFEIPMGKRVAIVGESGGGKTTICNLIMGFYVGYKGDIKIFGNSLKDISKESLWSEISMVCQDPFVFEGSLRKNLDPKGRYKDSEIIAKMKQCYICAENDDIDAPLEIATMATGGKQLVEIAREMLDSGDIVILDEATSSLDSVTEKKITASYQSLMACSTSIVIAHRISTIMNSDIVIAVKDGKIIEMGGVQELLEKDGYFRKLYELSIA